LETRLRFTPTNVLPYFPWPWKPDIEEGQLTTGNPDDEEVRAELQTAIENVEELRSEFLENPDDHGLSRDQIGGPTDLYNVYDSNPNGDEPVPNADEDAIDALRNAHVELLQAVLRAYARDAEQAELPATPLDPGRSWDELAEEWSILAEQCSRDGWDFQRPWLDRTERFVPMEPYRAKMFELIDRHNTLRAEQEVAMLGEHVLEVLTETDRTTKSHWKAFHDAGFNVERDTFDKVVEYLIDRDEIRGIAPGDSLPHGSSHWSAQ
jgi:hypothetical protein